MLSPPSKRMASDGEITKIFRFDFVITLRYNLKVFMTYTVAEIN
jgi:hypothetical protein